MRATLLLLLLLLAGLLCSCSSDPLEFDGDYPLCTTQTIQLPPPGADNWATTMAVTGAFWGCAGSGADRIALDPDTQDREWVVGCFTENAYAYRGRPGRSSAVVIVDDPPNGALIDECYQDGAGSPLCFVGGSGLALLQCADPWDCGDAGELRCLYVRDEPPL